MKNNNTDNAEFFELLRGALQIVYGKNFSIKQIEDAQEIAELSSSLFKDSLEKIYVRRYGATEKSAQSEQAQEKLEALWIVHSSFVDDLEKQCRCDAIARLGDYFDPEKHTEEPKLYKALKILFPKK